jgi:hypothetical protein
MGPEVRNAEEMAASYRKIAALVTVVGFAVGCHVEDPSDRAIEHPADTVTEAAGRAGGSGPAADGTTITPVANPATRPMTIDDPMAAQMRAQSIADSADRMLRKVRALSKWEQVKLRRDVNAIQIARARQLGIAPGSDPQQLLRSGRLVELAADTRLWKLHNLNYSVPYVTPSTESLLAEIGERFQAKLDSANVPRYRLVITSVLRTADKQAALRKANANASKIVSAHEFGTTVDIAYRRFAAPRDSGVVLSGPSAEVSDSVLTKAANLRSAELQAILGRVLTEMESAGKVMVMMERHQTVYHITVAKQYDKVRHIAD